MCGIAAAIGIVDPKIYLALENEILIRGLHSFGREQQGNAVMSHARYSTSGESGQPIKIGKTTMCFNGVIDMGTKSELQKRWKVKLTTDNDGEIIMRLCGNKQGVANFLRNNSCSYAGVWFINGELVAIRNTKRPLWVAEAGKAVYIASTKDIMKRAGLKKPSLMEPFELYSWKIK